MTTRVISTSSIQQQPQEITEAAKNWTKCLERFNNSIDSLYDICRETKNFAGCREVLLYLGNATHLFEALINAIDVEQAWEKDPSCKPLAWEIKAPSAANKQMQEQEGIWQLVSGRRRKNTLSSEDSGENESRSEKENKKTNVYERLAYGIPRRVRPFSPEIIQDSDSIPGNNLMCPRSAMDLPQTKASMAKMAYSRGRLWKDNIKPLLQEKLSTLQRRQARLTYSQVAKQPPKQKSEIDPNRSREPSLASISETAEENDDNLSTVTMAEQTAGFNSDKILAELGGDDQWLAMTMEEESLAQEEESLQKEILEEERSSIDDEFEREACKQFGKIRYKKSWKDVIANWTQLNEKVLPEICYRKPGEAVQMHEKLLSPSRRRTKTDFEKRHEERQQRAVELRQRLLEEKANRLKELHAKVEEIRQKRIEVEGKKRALLEEKMEKVSEKRERNLAEVVKRAKDDDLRIQEVQLIKTLEDMSRKSEIQNTIQSRDEERQEKLRTLAQKQAKKAEEKAAKFAQVEENRVAKMQRDAERLLEQTEKHEARLQNAAANRNELLEGMRQKQRKLTEKIDRLKIIESQASQNLIDRMQNKLEKAEKLYEETIFTTKQRAAELSSPRPPQTCSAYILSECLQPLSDSQPEDNKKCTVCKIRIHSSLHALAHVCTTEHLKNRKLEKMDLNFEEVKQELDTFIIQTGDDETDLKDIITSTITVSTNESKKKRSKLKQKLLKDVEPISMVSNGIIEKGIYRIIKELETQIQGICKAGSLTDSARNHIEKLFAQFDKQIFEIRDEKERENNFYRIISCTTILDSVFKLLALGDFYDPQNCRPATKRLYLKSCAFLACLFSPTKVAEIIFVSKYFTNLADLLIQSMKLLTDLNNNYELGISTLYILYQLGLAVSTSKDSTIKAKQKLSTLTAFLISHGFIDFIKAVLIQASEFKVSDKLELSPHSCIGIIETISGFINLVLRQIPDGQECHESFHQLFQTYFTISTNFLFNLLPREDSCPNSPIQIQSSENEEIISRNFFVSFSRDFIRLTPNLKTAKFLQRFIFKDDFQNGLRITFILNGIIQKRITKLLKFADLPLMAIRVTAYFSSIDIVCQRFCLIGWQHSLLLSLCRSFDLFESSHDLRYSILIAIFSIVRKSKVAIEAMETEIGVSWLSIFLEIFGKLQKFAKALKKNNSNNNSSREEHHPSSNQVSEESEFKVKSNLPKTSQSLQTFNHTKTTAAVVSEISVNPECCSEESVYNFASLHRHLNKIDEKKKEEPKPLQGSKRKPPANKTGNKKVTTLKSAPPTITKTSTATTRKAMPEKGGGGRGMTEVIERDRPPRPTPPKPNDIEIEEGGDGNGGGEEQLSEIASISSEDELLLEQEAERAKNQQQKKQQQQQQQYHQIRINHPPQQPQQQQQQYRHPQQQQLHHQQQHQQIREIPIQAQMIDPTQLIRIPAAAALREKMAEIFAVEEIGTVPLPRLMELRRHIQAINNIDYFFEAIPMNHLNHISVNIIETILHLIDDVDEVNELILKHVKNYLNFLFMCGNRSARFRRTFEKHSALHWLGMLRFDAIRGDVIYSLQLFTSNISILYTDENFMHFLSDIITNYQSFPESSEQKNYICMYIAKLLQDYPYFFHRSYTSLNRNVFNELLTIVEKIVKTKFDDDRKPPMLGSAVKFIIKFFDISIDDFREERVDWHAHVSRFVHLMDIMSFIIRNVKSYRTFFDKPALMHNICAIQDLLLTGDEINRCHRSGRRVEIPLNRNSGNRRSRNGEDNIDDRVITTTTTCGSAATTNDESVGGQGGVVRSKTMPSDGPPDRKYARKTVEQDSIENIPPVSSIILFPLPSVEILEMNLSTPFRTRESFLNLYRQRKISAFYILNLKRATLRLLGSLCIASSSNKDIAAEHEVVENVFKLARAGDSVKVDYVTLVKRALTEICTDHEKNLQALNDIEQHPSHLISKKDVIDTIYSNTHNGTAR